MNQQSRTFSERSLNKHDRDRDFTTLSYIERWILQRVGGRICLERELPMIARQAIEEVIDWPRTGRERIYELNRVERAYLGRRIEIMFKYWLGAARGKILDIEVDGIEVGVKNVFGTECWISNLSTGNPLLVLQTDLGDSRISLAILVARSNRTSLASRRAASNNIEVRNNCLIHWLCVDCEIKKSAIFTQMMLMYRRRAELERMQLRAYIDLTSNEMAKGIK